MSKTALIIKREYLNRVSKKSFLILTFLTPLLFAAMVFVPLWLSSIKGDEVRNVVVLDRTGKYAPLFEDADNYKFIAGDKSLESYKQASDKEVYAIVSITDDLIAHPEAATMYSEKQIPGDLSRIVNQVLSRKLENEKMATYNIPNLKEIIKESQINFEINTIKWSEDGSESESSSLVASIVGLIFTLISYMFIMVYGAMVMQGVMEEKTNRIVELMVSSVRPFQLMMGKIIGIGLVGLTQMFLWGILTMALVLGGQFLFMGSVDPQIMQQGSMMGHGASMPGMVEASQEPAAKLFGMLQTINFAEIGFFFVIYFIGGYMLYASVFAAIGSAVESQEDTQQFMTPIMIFLVFSLYAGIYSMENPEGPLAFWCSLIPFTSPIVMMIRLPFEVPLWEKLLSVSLLYVTFVGIIWLSAKIYRVGILMYGKKPTIKEMIKWLRYK
ncbi:MAG: ABC transporter permease [Parabacteroides sp.]|jgi:ABC-2 type transport system permease protein|nr:ABC transporter permease [Parabacteroides sp.]MBP9481078.1 ABC transporter permease [Parabacteroides sp.]MBP9577937.1 ABC transporter permease [Parabacteroides sp.]MDD2415319.1 ABC transporter permease [Parabacteroides sp.]MDD3358027.1 ABC transporter permease [Parabacteroides sp.]